MAAVRTNTGRTSYEPADPFCVCDARYDAGLNEGIAGQLAQAIRVSNQDNQSVGIQIVYGNVTEAVKKAESNDRPLLIYSWLPRAEIMTPNRFVRITLESFYHCRSEDAERYARVLEEPTFLAQPLVRGVTACDFPVEQVEKAAVWRLQQPSATNAKLFVGKFSLNSTQLQELLELGNELSLLQNSNSSPVSFDEIACRWLNNNTDAWEAWLPGSHLYDTTLFQWVDWLICCGVCFFVVLVCARIWEMNKESQKPVRSAQKGYWRLNMKQKNANGQSTNNCCWWMYRCCWWMSRCCISSFIPLTTLSCWNNNCSGNKPLRQYLSDAAWCLVNFGLDQPEQAVWLFLYALGQVFVAASSGLFKIILFETWLGDGLSKLSLEVSISCAVLMLTLELIEWFIDYATITKLIPSGEEIVRHELGNELKSKTTEDQQFKNAEKLAKTLASDCYMSAVKAFYQLLGVGFAISFLFYDTFKEGVPQDPSPLTIVAFFLGPMWLILGLGSLRLRTIKCKHCAVPTCHLPFHNEETKTAKEIAAEVKSYKVGFSAVKWISTYLLWALAPIFMTP